MECVLYTGMNDDDDDAIKSLNPNSRWLDASRIQIHPNGKTERSATHATANIKMMTCALDYHDSYVLWLPISKYCVETNEEPRNWRRWCLSMEEMKIEKNRISFWFGKLWSVLRVLDIKILDDNVDNDDDEGKWKMKNKQIKADTTNAAVD